MELKAIEKIEDVELKVIKKEENKISNQQKEIVKFNDENDNKIDTIVKKLEGKNEEDIKKVNSCDGTIKEIHEHNEDSLGGELVTGLNSNIKINGHVSSNKDIKVVFAKEEMFKLNTKITYEYNKTIGELDFSKIREYRVEDGNKIISFLFYDNDFYAVNRVNFKDGYMYSEKREVLPISENLNSKIRKIPNVAKARKILNIQNIEARIYDMTEYILLLERRKIRVIKVKENGDLVEMNFSEYPIDRKKLELGVEKLSFANIERKREERSIKNRLDGFKRTIKKHVVNPIREVLIKMGIINDVKLLADGKRSVFEKKM